MGGVKSADFPQKTVDLAAFGNDRQKSALLSPPKAFLKLIYMRLFCFLFLLGGFAACQTAADPCPKLLEKRDYALTNSLDSLLFHRDEMSEDSFRVGLGVLHSWELQLFADVRQCNFDRDQTRSYYWYRGRLKFPSPIQQEIEKFNRASPPAPQH